ncbi:MAG: DUF4270 family protein [Marinifilaceae bacterium]
MRKRCVLLVLLSIVLLWSCKEENSQIAEGLFESDKAIVVPDVAFDVNGMVESDANAVTNNITTGFVGTYNDPVIGKISSAVAFEFRTQQEWKFDNTDDVIVDSVCVHIDFKIKNSLYDTITSQKVNLYRLKTSLRDVKRSVDLIGSKDAPISFKGDLWATKEINNKSFDITNTKRDDTGKLVSIDVKKHDYISFKLNESAVKTIQKEFISNSDIYFSQDNFTNFFKGIYLESDGIISKNNGGLFAFNIPTPKTIFVIYYRLKSESEDKDGNKLSKNYKVYKFGFKANSNSNRLNIFRHNINNGIIGSKKPLYILGGAGLRAHLTIDELDEKGWLDNKSWFSKKDRFINKAEISLKLDPNTVLSDTIIPSSLIMVAFNKKGDIVSIPGFIAESNNKPFLDGYYYKKTKEYKFNIAFLLQNIANYSEVEFYKNTMIDLSKGFAVYPAHRREDPRRVILDGESIKLNVTYTKL